MQKISFLLHFTAFTCLGFSFIFPQLVDFLKLNFVAYNICRTVVPVTVLQSEFYTGSNIPLITIFIAMEFGIMGFQAELEQGIVGTEKPAGG